MKKYSPPTDVIRTKIKFPEDPKRMIKENGRQLDIILEGYPYLTPFHVRHINTKERTEYSPADEMAYQIKYTLKDGTWPGFLVEDPAEIRAMMDIVKEYELDKDPRQHWCLQCGYNWKSKEHHTPTMCPACKRRSWDNREDV
jgi:hypothetical protein